MTTNITYNGLSSHPISTTQVIHIIEPTIAVEAQPYNEDYDIVDNNALNNNIQILDSSTGIPIAQPLRTTNNENRIDNYRIRRNIPLPLLTLTLNLSSNNARVHPINDNNHTAQSILNDISNLQRISISSRINHPLFFEHMHNRNNQGIVLADIVKKSYFVRRGCILNFIFIIIFIIYFSVIYVLAIFIPLIGYAGARNYNPSALIAYAFYIVIDFIVSIIALVYFPVSSVYFNARLLFLLFNVVNIYMTVKLLILSNNLSQSDYEILTHLL